MTSKIVVNNIEADAGISTVNILSDVTASGTLSIGTNTSTELITVGAAITTALFEVKPHSAGYDINVNSGDFAPHFQRDFVIYNGQPGSGTERFRISSEGYVTAPNQPAFFVHINGGDVTTTSGDKIAWNQTRINRGGCYSTSTYQFTAPVAGVYCFQSQIWAKNGATNSRSRYFKNGAARSQNGYHGPSVSNQVDHAYEMTLLEDMQVGDTMDIRATDADLTMYAGNLNEVHSFFSGFLVG